MRLSELQRALATVRDFSRAPGERALAATLLAAGDSDEEQRAGSTKAPVDPALRMFGYGVVHDDALPWDGKSIRSGTITYAEGDRVEQYIGRSSWIVYGTNIFGEDLPQAGDQLRIARRNDSTRIECVGPNRLAGRAQVAHRSSGMLLLRRTPLEDGELEKAAAVVAERYSAVLDSTTECATMDFAGGACFTVALARSNAAEAVIRLCVDTRTDRPQEACDAERAMVLCAALLTMGEASAVVDDTTACFTSDILYELARRNGMRADSFRFAAAAAQRAFPVLHSRVFDDSSDELTVFSAHASEPDFAFATLGRALQAFADAAEACEDPVVPAFMEGVAPEHRGEAGEVQLLAQLAYEKIEIVIAFVDVAAATGTLAERVALRSDVQALLGAPIRSAVVFAVRIAAEDAGAPPPLETHRADVLITALAAIFTLGNSAIASDADGALYCASDLTELALRRQGKATSCNVPLRPT